MDQKQNTFFCLTVLISVHVRFDIHPSFIIVSLCLCLEVDTKSKSRGKCEKLSMRGLSRIVNG